MWALKRANRLRGFESMLKIRNSSRTVNSLDIVPLVQQQTKMNDEENGEEEDEENETNKSFFFI